MAIKYKKESYLSFRMYEIFTANSKTEKLLRGYILMNPKIKEKLDKLKQNPKKEIGAHPLHGKFKGKFACWLESNLRAIYTINEKTKLIIIEAVGTHKIYQ
jgi:addiction module RelE/StbE family toxin